MNKFYNKIILTYKPPFFSSYDIIRLFKKVHKGKIGHTGTLDPFAEGLLLLLTDKYTKLSHIFLHKKKEYVGTLKLGISTDTLDITGKITSEDEKWKNLSIGEIKNAFFSLKGEIQYRAPLFSAKKIQGIKSYQYARNNKNALTPLVKSYIYKITIEKIDLPYIIFYIKCSGGTYIRSIAELIGKILNTSATLTKLTRTAIDNFSIQMLDKEININHVKLKYTDFKIYDFLPEEKIKNIPLSEVNFLKNGVRKFREKYFSLLKEYPYYLLANNGTEIGIVADKKFFNANRHKIIFL